MLSINSLNVFFFTGHYEFLCLHPQPEPRCSTVMQIYIWNELKLNILEFCRLNIWFSYICDVFFYASLCYLRISLSLISVLNCVNITNSQRTNIWKIELMILGLVCVYAKCIDVFVWGQCLVDVLFWVYGYASRIVVSFIYLRCLDFLCRGCVFVFG